MTDSRSSARCVVVLFTSMALGLTVSSPTRAAQNTYLIDFQLSLHAAKGEAVATLTVVQPQPMLKRLRLHAPVDRYSDFSGDGAVRRTGDELTWTLPARGGRLHYQVTINHRRDAMGYDALVGSDWAVFRGDDVFPPAAATHVDGAESVSTLSLELPKSWSALTPFAPDGNGKWIVDNPRRRFDRPTGWITAGRLGVRRDSVAGIKLAVGGPVGMGIQRVSMLALLRWTLPTLTTLLPVDQARLTVVSAGDPMWHGGLSAPQSLFIHARRPLLSENGTSTLLHEAIHVLAPVPTEPDQDWIDEGLAEYLTLETLLRSGTISPERYRATLKRFRKQARHAGSLDTTQASGAITARAVTLFHELDLELRSATGGQQDIYDLTARLMQQKRPVNRQRLKELAAELAGGQRLKSL